MTWASSNAAVATISAAGLATGKGIGTASIAAEVDGITGSTSIKVALPAPVTVTLVQPVLNKKHMVTEIVVTFSGGVNAMEAQDVSTFRLVKAGKGNSFTAKNATVIAHQLGGLQRGERHDHAHPEKGLLAVEGSSAHDQRNASLRIAG